MSNFILDGRLDVANALVGTFHGEDGLDQTFIIALIPDALPAKEQRELKEKLLQAGPQNFARWIPEDENLSTLFSVLAKPPLTMTITDAAPAKDMIELALVQKATKNVIFCTNADAYLSVCDRFGVSRRDLTSIGELSALLPKAKQTISDHGIVGSAHKLCHAMATGKADYVLLSTNEALGAPKEIWPRVIADIQRAEKFKFGRMSNLEFLPQAFEELQKGQRTIYTPADNCLFEYDLDNRSKAFLLTQLARSRGKFHEGKEFGEEDLISTLMILSEDGFCSVQTWQSLMRIENGMLKNTSGLLPAFRLPAIAEKAKKDLAITKNMGGEQIGLVLAALATVNAPSYRPEIVQPPEPLQKKRMEKVRRDPTEFPYFDYHVIDVAKTIQRENFTTAASAQSSGVEDSGIRQRFHHRSASLRTITHADGSCEIKRFKDYWAGDASLGVIAKTRDAETAAHPSPQLPV